MKYGVSGTGDVGHVIASKLIDLGHEVMMGARSASSEKRRNGLKNMAAMPITEHLKMLPNSGNASSTARREFMLSKHWNWQEKITSMEKF